MSITSLANHTPTASGRIAPRWPTNPVCACRGPQFWCVPSACGNILTRPSEMPPLASWPHSSRGHWHCCSGQETRLHHQATLKKPLRRILGRALFEIQFTHASRHNDVEAQPNINADTATCKSKLQCPVEARPRAQLAFLACHELFKGNHDVGIARRRGICRPLTGDHSLNP